MTPTIYCGDHQHAKVVCSAFAEGCGGKLVPATSGLRDGPAAMWGILRGAGDRLKECELYGQPYFYIDHGYFRRGHYDGYYRVVFCDRHLTGEMQKSCGGRWKALGLEPKPWRRRGKVVYLPISRHVAAFKGIDAGEFDEQQIAGLRNMVGEVLVKGKDDGDLAECLSDAKIVAGYQSNALFEAALEGCGTVELGDSPALGIYGNAYLSIDTREQVFSWLADNQWTLEEMRSGKCWSDLMAMHGDALAA